MAIVGDERSVASQLDALSASGATELVASVFPERSDGPDSPERTLALLARLAQR